MLLALLGFSTTSIATETCKPLQTHTLIIQGSQDFMALFDMDCDGNWDVGIILMYGNPKHDFSGILNKDGVIKTIENLEEHGYSIEWHSTPSLM